MLRKNITFTNFDGEKVTETHYFNLTKAELIMFQNQYHGGVQSILQEIVDAKDNVRIMEFFTKFIKLAYGIRTDEGRFVKSEQISEDFVHTEAYSELFMELFTDASAGAKFVGSVLPSDIDKQTANSTQDQLPIS